MTSLDKCAAGYVVETRLAGSVGRRLADMGLVPGTFVRVIGRAPLGDPMRLFLRGYTLTVREEDARRVIVREDA